MCTQVVLLHMLTNFPPYYSEQKSFCSLSFMPPLSTYLSSTLEQNKLALVPEQHWILFQRPGYSMTMGKWKRIFKTRFKITKIILCVVTSHSPKGLVDSARQPCLEHHLWCQPMAGSEFSRRCFHSCLGWGMGVELVMLDLSCAHC